MDESKSKSYYQVLEIPVDASAEEVHQGYLRAKNAYSQDSLALYSLMSEEECSRILELIDEAYSIISDPDKRRQYDEARGIKSSTPQSAPRSPVQPTMANQEETQNLKTLDTTSEKNMNKIVAKKRFSLEYKEDADFEAEIEQTTTFTGDFLRRIREYKNVDLPRMADMTKVSKTYLRYIEEENTTNLPALVYVRGFVYQYAKCLKLNPDTVATSYLNHLKSTLESQE